MKKPLISVPSTRLSDETSRRSADSMAEGRCDHEAREVLWRGLELASTQGTLTVHWACWWSSVFSRRWVRRAVGLTVDVGAARILQWRHVPPQLHVSRQRCLPQPTGTPLGAMVDTGSITTRV